MSACRPCAADCALNIAANGKRRLSGSIRSTTAPRTQALPHQVWDDQFDHIAAAQLAMNCHVIQSKTSQVRLQFKPRVDCPYLFRQQRPILGGDPVLVPGSSFRSDCGNLDSWHDVPADLPAKLTHQRRADIESLHSV